MEFLDLVDVGFSDKTGRVKAEEGGSCDDSGFKRGDHVDDVTVGFSWAKTHAAANHLDKEVSGAGGAREEDAIDVGDVGAFSEDTTV